MEDINFHQVESAEDRQQAATLIREYLDLAAPVADAKAARGLKKQQFGHGSPNR